MMTVLIVISTEQYKVVESLRGTPETEVTLQFILQKTFKKYN